MVQVQQRALGTFEQDVLAISRCLMNRLGALHHVGGEALAVSQIFLDDVFGVQGRNAINGLKKFVLLLKWAFKAIPQPLFVQQVDHTDATALRLVGVGGADSTACGSDPSCSPLLLHGLVEQAVVGHRHVGCGCQAKP